MLFFLQSPQCHICSLPFLVVIQHQICGNKLSEETILVVLNRRTSRDMRKTWSSITKSRIFQIKFFLHKLPVQTKTALEGQSIPPYFQLSFRKECYGHTGEILSLMNWYNDSLFTLAVAREGLLYSLLQFPCGQELMRVGTPNRGLRESSDILALGGNITH